MAVVGQFSGKEALATVGSNNSIINLLINLFVGFLVGTNVIISRQIGAGNREKVSRSAHAAISLSVICGVRFIWIYGVLPLNPTYENLLAVYPVSWILTTVAITVAFTIYSKNTFKGKEEKEFA